MIKSESVNHSVVSDSSLPHGLQPTSLLHPWDFPGKSTGVGCHCLLWHGLRRMHNFCMEVRGFACTFSNSHAKYAKASLLDLSLEVMSEQLRSLDYHGKYFIQKGHSHKGYLKGFFFFSHMPHISCFHSE